MAGAAVVAAAFWAAWVCQRLDAAQAEAVRAQMEARAEREARLKEANLRADAEAEVSRLKEQIRCELEGVAPECLARASEQELASYMYLCAEHRVTPYSTPSMQGEPRGARQAARPLP